MTERLPTIGEDPYGTTFLGWLGVSHAADGTLKTAAVEAALGGSQAAPKQTVVIFGDSITAQNTTNSPANANGFGHKYAAGYWNQAQLLLRHRFSLLANAGVGGNVTAQMLARIQADVIAYAPGYVIVQGGGNDVTTDIDPATTIANLTAIYTLLQAAGIVVVATTVLPSVNVDTTPRKLALQTINNWLRGYVRTQPGMILCDWYACVADPATMVAATNMTTDGVHPSQTGAFLLGAKLAAELSSVTYLADPLPDSNVESGLVLPNPRMVGAAPGTSVTVAANSGTPTLTQSKVARTDGVQGEWSQVVASGGVDNFRVQQQATVNVGANTTATGVNALNSATVNVGSTTGFTAPGAFVLGGVSVPYTGITGTSFTGCGNHAATTGGEAITSPANVGDYVYATAEVEIDAGATMVAKAGEVPVQLAVLNQDAGSLTSYDMFAATGEGTYPGGIPTGRLVLRTPNYLLPAGSSRLYVRVLCFLNGTIRVGRMQIYKV